MSEQYKSRKRKLDTHENQLLVRDVVRHMAGLAKLYADEKTGNPELSEGLRQVVEALRPYSTYPVHKLGPALEEAKHLALEGHKASARRKRTHLPSNLEGLRKKDIENILSDESYTKVQIAELGSRRFGIPRATLERQRKEDALMAVRAALENEKALDVISQVARRSGKTRTS